MSKGFTKDQADAALGYVQLGALSVNIINAAEVTLVANSAEGEKLLSNLKFETAEAAAGRGVIPVGSSYFEQAALPAANRTVQLTADVTLTDGTQLKAGNVVTWIENGGYKVVAADGSYSVIPTAAVPGQPLALPRPVYIDFATAGDVAPGYYRADPSQLRFTQPDASPFFSRGGTIDDTINALRSGAITADQVGSPLQIVIQDGIPFSIDNRRLVTFNTAGVNDIPIQVMSLDDPVVAQRFFSRFDPIGGTGEYIVITPSKGRDAAPQLLKDHGLINGFQIGK